MPFHILGIQTHDDENPIFKNHSDLQKFASTLSVMRKSLWNKKYVKDKILVKVNILTRNFQNSVVDS